jgi:hypothetical protein
MKNLFSTALTDVKTTDVEGVGSIRIEADGKQYRWCKNNASTSWAAGCLVCHEVANLGADLYKTAIIPASADLALLAGVAMGVVAQNYFGWVQIAGPHSDVLISKVTALVAGDSVVPSNGINYGVRSAALGAASYRRCVTLLEANATTASATAAFEAMINCL